LVSSDQRLIAEAWAGTENAIAIVRDIQRKDVPAARWIVGLADCNKELRRRHQSAGVRVPPNLRLRNKEVSGAGIKVGSRIAEIRTKNIRRGRRGSYDRRRKAKKLVQRFRAA
jgi:hypothetical protein